MLRLTVLSLIETDRHFRSAYCLHLQGDMSSLIGRSVSIRLNGASSQKAVSFNLQACYVKRLSRKLETCGDVSELCIYSSRIEEKYSENGYNVVAKNNLKNVSNIVKRIFL
jgi:hypothetical protein